MEKRILWKSDDANKNPTSPKVREKWGTRLSFL
jgi:hypothetical protein